MSNTGNTRLLWLAALALLLQACQSTMPTREMPEPVEEEFVTYSSAPFLDLVARYAEEGGQSVDYAAWQASGEDMAALDRHIALLAQISPESHPAQFPRRADERSYWINAYNALVLHAVLEYWPLDSVRDVKLTLSSRVVPGKGFFYDRKVVVGGRETNLYDLEKQVLRSQKDPRLHFALNCGSESCPVLRPWEWTDEQLDQAAREFVNQPENVAVEDGVLRVSKIFDWYRKDFPADLAAYLADYAEPGLRDELTAASDGAYKVRYRDYDWSLNNAGNGAEHGAGNGTGTEDSRAAAGG